MRILYAIQGTGNGHLSRATDIVPALRQYGDVDILVSGKNSQVAIPFDIRYRLSGLSFVFGKKDNIEFIETFKQANLKKLWNEIRNLPNCSTVSCTPSSKTLNLQGFPSHRPFSTCSGFTATISTTWSIRIFTSVQPKMKGWLPHSKRSVVTSTSRSPC